MNLPLRYVITGLITVTIEQLNTLHHQLCNACVLIQYTHYTK